ncbi:aminotransferase class IV [Pseudahrensia aquimaris]|uniref:Probable branched-chain-amino-acid aminotransferase n=1 Tax=Pseudahrensia aquimaris TaxID=744461 RepID=A0ABW3FF41_9HYPH
MDAVGPDFSKGAAWMAGEIVPIADAKISVLDWGLTHSDITYDVVHVWDGVFFRMDDYLDRFFESIAKLHLDVPQTRSEMREILHAIVARSGLQRSYVSLVASRGVPGIPGSRDPRDCINHFYAWCVPFVWVFTEEMVARGVKLMVPDFVQRIAPEAVDPTAKNYHWGDFTQGLIAAKQAHYDNTVLVDTNGNVTEGPGFNIFMVKDGIVRTPRRGMLEGITRRTAIEMCAACGIECVEEDVLLAEMMEADEVFATTTGGGVVAVVQMNERVFSNGVAGPVTSQLSQLYWNWHEDPKFIQPVNYQVSGE